MQLTNLKLLNKGQSSNPQLLLTGTIHLSCKTVWWSLAAANNNNNNNEGQIES